ncbi:MAG: phenylalanine--tRNA ligase subunit beta [Pseudonocardia sp.]
MKISLEWISDYVRLPSSLTPRELADDLTLKTVEVEEIETIDGDVVFEIDNKSLTNRPDLWGHYGIAREFAAIYGLPLAQLPTVSLPEQVEGLIGPIDTMLCRRFSVIELSVDNSRPTPETVRRRLAHIGESTVNLMVDLSNYVMFTVGQPNHVWDAGRVQLPMTATTSTEPFDLHLVTSDDMRITGPAPVIRDEVGILGLAGIMGGEESSVHSDSTRFLLETATFDAQSVRRTSQRLGLRTEASARYEKGLDTQRIDVSIGVFLGMLAELAPEVVVHRFQDVVAEATPSRHVHVDRPFLDSRIGVHLEDAEISGTLGALGFGVEVDETAVEVAVPTWRSTGDISLPHDVLEELARIHGYDRLPSSQVAVVLAPVRSLNRRPLDRSLREELALRGGLQEVITYPWVRDELLATAGFPKERTVLFEGATAPDHNALRPALLPNLLDAIASNLRYRSAFGIFELGIVFTDGSRRPHPGGGGEDLPTMPKNLALALVGVDDGATLFRRAKGHLEALRRHCFLDDLALDGPSEALWADRSARLGIMVGTHQAGTLALLQPRLLRLAGIQGVHVAYAELDITPLTAKASRENLFQALAELPASDFDLSVLLADGIPWARVEAVAGTGNKLVETVTYVGEYRSAELGEDFRSLTLRVRLQPHDVTLTRDDILRVRTDILQALEKEFGAKLR